MRCVNLEVTVEKKKQCSVDPMTADKDLFIQKNSAVAVDKKNFGMQH